MAQSESGSGSGRTYPDHTAPRPSGQTAKMRENAFCENCGWPVIFAFCNDGMGQMAPYSDWDNWIYCANKTCLHHGGEGIYHNVPEWIKTTG
jgi:hypothetical protein